MESALYGIYALIVFVSENSCVNTVRVHFPWSNLYLWYLEVSTRAVISQFSGPHFPARNA